MKPFVRVWIAAAASSAFCLVLTGVCGWQPDSCAVLLIWPRWLWLAPGLLLAAGAWQRSRPWFTGAAGLAWLVYAGIFVEELHWHLQPAAPAGVPVRVVSLNCAGGNKFAAAEVIALNPDIALFQESPSRPEIAAVARQLNSSTAGFAMTRDTAGDTSIIACGHVEQLAVDRPWNIHFTEARVTLTNQLQVAVICLRLWPYDLRADVWTPDCWRTQADVRHRQRELLNWLVMRMAGIPRNLPLIVGGDFNLAGNDALLRLLQPRLHDSFLTAGTGLGNTLINELPFVRIDQLWVNDHIPPLQVRVQRTQNSDHRLVVADLIIRR